MVITDIGKGRRGNVSLFCDGKYTLSLNAGIIIKKGIKVGNQIDEDMLEELKRESEFYKAKEKALNLLTYRGRSKKELKERIARDVDEVYASLAVDKMAELGLIDDKAFAKQYAEELLLSKKYSLFLTKYKLRIKGISEEIIEDVLSDFDIDEEKQVVFLLNNKFSNKIIDEKSKNRVINSLIRMGYSLNVIKKAFSISGKNFIEDETI